MFKVDKPERMKKLLLAIILCLSAAAAEAQTNPNVLPVNLGPIITLAPNPAEEWAYVSYSGLRGNFVEVEAFDSNGDEVFEVTQIIGQDGTGTVALPTGQWKHGVYTVIISSPGFATQKLLLTI